jgi:hypothetical protein
MRRGLVVVLEGGIVRREERYLEVKVGEQYRSYRARVSGVGCESAPLTTPGRFV